METTENIQPEIPATILPKRGLPLWGWLLILGFGLNLALSAGCVLFGFLFYYLPGQYAEAPLKAEWATLNVNRLAFQSQKDFKTAQDRLLASLLSEKEERGPLPRLLLADLFDMMGKRDAAIFFYRDTLAIAEANWFTRLAMNPLANHAHEKLALLYYENNDRVASLSEIKAMGDLDENAENPALLLALQNSLEEPNRADFHLALARLLRSELRLKQARSEVEAATRIGGSAGLQFQTVVFQRMEIPVNGANLPPLGRYYLMAGNTLAYEENYNEAAIFYQKAIHESPDVEWAYSALAVAFHEMKLDRQAYVAVKKAIALNPNAYAPHLTLGSIALDGSRFQEAISHLRTGQALMAKMPLETVQTEIPAVENQLGYAFENLKNYREAAHHYTQALATAQQDESGYEGDYEYARKRLAEVAKNY